MAEDLGLNGDNGMLLPEEQAPSAMPGQGSAPADESKSGGRRTGPVNQANLVLAGLFAVGIVVVYLLSLGDGPAQASAQQLAAEQQVESVLQKLDQKGEDPANKVQKASKKMRGHQEAMRQRQVAAEDLGGNPFVFKPAQPKPKVGTKSKKRRVTKDPAEQRWDDALAVVKRLKLQMVLAGQEPKASISGVFLEVGEVIQGWTIAKILPQKVVLTWRDKTYTLEME